jgi:DNA uptake protein ComE-like DNA-binding protein
VPTKQRVVLLILIALSLLQQGVRWKQSSFEPQVVQAAEAAAPAQEGRHCPLVHVNTAGLAELQTLPGIGPVLAERIIIERKRNLSGKNGTFYGYRALEKSAWPRLPT